MVVEYGPTPTEKGVPQGTDTSTGVNPGKTNLQLHSEGTPIMARLDELITDELRLDKLDKLLALDKEFAEFELDDKLEDLELIDETKEPEETLELVAGTISELKDEASKLDRELVAGIADETLIKVTLELDGAIELEEDGTRELDDKAIALDARLEELGVDDELVVDEAEINELEADIKDELVALDAITGVVDETDTIAELDKTELDEVTTELAIDDELLIKLETNELKFTEDELAELGIELLKLKFELALLKLDTSEDELELKLELLIKDSELLLLELLSTEDASELSDDTDELTILDILELERLELVKDELLLEEEMLSADALNTEFSGLLHGIVKSKLIAKKLY